MSDRIYDIDYSKLSWWMIPEAIAGTSKTPRWAAILIAPVVFIYQQLLNFRTAKIYQLRITPQVCYLEKLLNDRFDYTSRRIYISDPVSKLPVYLYRRDENKPVFLYTRAENKPVFLYTRGESGSIQNDFIINAPSVLVFEDAEMISLVNGFKLAGKKFKIQRF